jgi:hypothetical protein
MFLSIDGADRCRECSLLSQVATQVLQDFLETKIHKNENWLSDYLSENSLK